MREPLFLFVVVKIIVISLCLGFSCSEEAYISPAPPCHQVPSKPCLSLGQLANDTRSWLESNTTWIFLKGTHILPIELSVSSINNISLVSESLLEEPQTVVVCDKNTRLRFDNISNMLLRGMNFLGCESDISSVRKLSIKKCTFKGQNSSGSALDVNRTNVNIFNSSFILNTVGTCVTMTSPELTQNFQTLVGGAIIARAYCNITIVKSTFASNRAEIGGAIFAGVRIYINIINSTFINNHVAAAINSIKESHCHTDISLYYDSFLSQSSHLSSNGRFVQGGAIVLFNGTLVVNGSTFINNGNEEGLSGVLGVQDSTANIYNSEFHNSHTISFGGVLTATGNSHVILDNCTVCNSTAQQGGVMDIAGAYVTIRNSILSDNTARTLSGGVVSALQNSFVYVSSSQFINNRAMQAGGVLNAVTTIVSINGSTTLFLKNKAGNFGGVMSLSQSDLKVDGNCILENNLAKNGGAIYAVESTLSINNEMSVLSNVASDSGGGLYVYHCTLDCNYGSTVNVSGNRANTSGGGIYASNSFITVFHNRQSSQQNRSSVYFIKNVAQRGGGLSLMSAAQLHIFKNGGISIDNKSNVLYFDSNLADYGEAIYVNDETYYDVCSRGIHSNSDLSATECFIQVLSPMYTFDHLYHLNSIKFTQTNTSNASVILYGGLLDRCTLNSHAEYEDKTYGKGIDGVTYLMLISNINSTSSITSAPVRLCFCTPEDQPDCNYIPPQVKVTKGERFNLSLVAVDQVNHTLSDIIVHCSLSNPESGLGYGQQTQKTMNACTNLNFSISSPLSTADLILYAEGPCRNVTWSQSRLTVTFENCTCPKIGFQPKQVGSHAIDCECVCDSRLYPYFTDNECNYQTGSLTRNGNFWITYVYVNVTNSSGYVIYPHCPLDYCLPNIAINLNMYNGSDDSQCANNRSGVLCGSCQSGLSLSLGSSRCLQCSKLWYKTFLTMLTVALIAGIVVVILLMVLNLTVAVGTLNGLIFYANILGANGVISSTKIPSILISWLNLEVGFHICFFEGMDTYWKTWIKLAFPSYVIFLVIVIIFVSNHSIKFSHLIAKRDPVATLATLILLSYTMFLRTTIAVLSFAILNYPDGSSKWVWLHDGTVEYVSGRHIALFVVALFILIVGIAYTSILFFWQWIIRYQNKTVFRWARYQKLHHFITPYHAPYNIKHRYWTGCLLFARVILYLLFTLNASSDPGENLLAIAVLVSALLFIKAYVGRIYKNKMINCLEMTCHFNAALFSAVQLYLLKAGSSHARYITAYISVAVTMILFIMVLCYHMWTECCLRYLKRYGKQQRIGQIPLPDENEGNLANYPPDNGNVIVAPTFSVLEGPRNWSNAPSSAKVVCTRERGQRSRNNEIEDDNESVESADSKAPLLDECD